MAIETHCAKPNFRLKLCASIKTSKNEKKVTNYSLVKRVIKKKKKKISFAKQRLPVANAQRLKNQKCEKID